MSNYLSLDEAAKKLGIPTDKLVELRSSGEVRGFRDGASWKFPDNEIARLKDQLPDLLASGLGLAGMSGGEDDSSIDIAGDLKLSPHDDSSVDLGSDVNLIANEDGSDVSLIADGDSDDMQINLPGDDDLVLSGNDLLELDSAELKLSDPAILHRSDVQKLDDEGSDVGVGDEIDLVGSDLNLQGSTGGSGSAIDIGEDLSLSGSGNSGELSGDLNLAGDDEDSGEDVIGGEDSEEVSLDDDDFGFAKSGSSLSLDLGDSDDKKADKKDAASSLELTGREQSSLELMSDLSGPSDANDSMSASRGVDVLSELDLLSSAAGGSGLIGGDSDNLLGSDSGLGSSLNEDALANSNLAGLDDALDDDDDLVIADDDDDLVISSAGSDISVAGDSGINLMSPSDSGLSLESEPLDLAGSSISALDLGAELADGSDVGSGPALDGSGGQVDEEFQLSPSGIGLEGDIDSASQVIEVEDSGEAVAEDPFGESAPAFEEEGDVFGEPVAEGGFDDGEMAAEAVDDDDAGVAIDPTATTMSRGGMAAPVAYEVPFTLLQTVSLMLILVVFSIGGILMTDLVRNMWTYTEPSAPVSSLTDWLIDSVGMGG